MTTTAPTPAAPKSIKDIQVSQRISDKEAAEAAGVPIALWKHFRDGGSGLDERQMRHVLAYILKRRADEIGQTDLVEITNGTTVANVGPGAVHLE